VLLPGLLCDAGVWEPQICSLGEVLVIDYGAADSLARMAEITLREAPAQFALAGHSMGGRVALEVYRRDPERVLRLGLFDTGYTAKPAGEAGAREEQGRYRLLDIARREGMCVMTGEWLPPMLHPSRRSEPELSAQIIAMPARKTPAIHAAQIKALLDRPDATDVLRTVRCPALLLTGDADTLSPPESHGAMAAAIAGSRLVIVPECGHMSTLERPEAVMAAMRDWLAAPRGNA
jgi:pimeloyl-ACP methyl ester carboxylesterase